jgi:phosphoglycerate dehydrogenase-like enzyme
MQGLRLDGGDLVAPSRPTVALAASQKMLDGILASPNLERIRALGDVRAAAFEQGWGYVEAPQPDPEADRRLIEHAQGATALILSMGAPRVTGEIMDALPDLRFIGELEGDRFANRIDVEAAWQRGIRTVDTTNGSSYGVAEWALTLMLIGLRNAGEQFLEFRDRGPWFHSVDWESRRFKPDELTGRTVGMIGCGIIGRRLLELLEPFGCEILVHDPYVPRELADIYDVTFTSLEHVLSDTDVVVCLAPITPATHKMLGAAQLAMIRDSGVFVNVSRGQIVDSDALIAELRSERIVACLDVFDPEPIPDDSPIRELRNVFVTPHTAAATKSTRGRNIAIMADELERFLAGHETRYDLLPRTIANRFGKEPPRRA